MKTRQAAIIGAGAIHTCHVEALSHVPDVALRALVDIDSDKGSRLAAGYGCQFYQDYREMLLDDAVDVVHICTPHHQHKPMILAALAAGKQVFCEKPMVMNPLDVAEIKSAAAIAQRHVGICGPFGLRHVCWVFRRRLHLIKRERLIAARGRSVTD